jgi:hypothetical protein
MIDLLLPTLFIAYISLVILDHFLTIIGIRRGFSERMRGTKALIEKHGLEKGMKIRTAIEIGIGTIILMLYFILDFFIPNIHISIDIVYLLLVIAFSIITINNVHTLRNCTPQTNQPS